jgi:epoxyqueuosine reductase QueG
MREKIKKEFQKLCKLEKRKGIVGFASLNNVKLLPVQKRNLKRKLASFDPQRPITAISIGVCYTPKEIKSIPDCWVVRGSKLDHWNDYARACGKINRILNRISQALAEKFGGITEQATVEGYTQKVRKVEEYYDMCVSHRVFAEEAGLGWRGKSGLIITPENGSALRLSTIFVPYHIKSVKKIFQGCGDCQLCLQVCPFLKAQRNNRQGCLLRLKKVGLENEVCGICIRVCWEKLKKSKTGEEIREMRVKAIRDEE